MSGETLKRIAVFQSELGVGGIQKSLINLLNNMDYDRAEVDLYLSNREDFWETEFPPELKVRFLPGIPRIYSFMPFDAALRRVKLDFADMGEYDLAIDFNSYQFSCASGAILVPAKKRVMWVHNNVEIKLQNEWKYRVLWHFFKGKFKYYDGFVCVSGALVEPFKKMSGAAEKEYHVIQNYIDVADIRRKAEEEPEGFETDGACLNLVALGRLTHQKGYDIMLDIFAEVCRQRQDMRLYIIGDGDERHGLEALAEELGIADKVNFLGSQSNPYCYMNKMDAFISTSRYEGQGMNIMEAMAIGLPLYCTKNLEQYIGGLHGREDMVSALLKAEKEKKHPDELVEYNSKIINSVIEL